MLLAEHATQGGYVLGEIVLFDDRVRPDRGHQLVLFYDRPGTLYKVEQNVESLRHQGHDLGILPYQQPFTGVERKSFELVHLSLAAVQRTPHKFSQNLIAILTIFICEMRNYGTHRPNPTIFG